jgi:acetylornithine deacetylase/succinyl-diaminopimelate desuccinylase-like protein
MFDPKWREHGHMQRAVDLLAGWAKDHLPPGATLEVVQVEDRTPVIFIEVPGTARDGDTVLMYGHLDKQPEMTGWDDGLGPWLPVMRGERLYGRGGADDGYAIFASLTALNVLAEQGRPYARCCVLIEACEESGSFDLPAYIEHLAPRIGTPSLVVCLDSGCGNYDQLWCTTSLRGLVLGTLEVSLLREGVHSGDGSGGGGVELPGRPGLARSPRGRRQRRDQARGAVRHDPARADRAGVARRRRAGRRGVVEVPAAARGPAGPRRRRRADLEPDPGARPCR